MVESQAAVNGVLYPELVRRISCVGRREDVLRRMWAGMGTKEIAADLGISPKTVEYHRGRLYELFRVRDPVSLCRRAIEARIIKVQRRPRGGTAHAN